MTGPRDRDWQYHDHVDSGLQDEQRLERQWFEPPPRLWRSHSDKVLAGVIGGLSEKFGLESKPARILYALLTAGTGGLLAVPYLVFWAITRQRGAPSMPKRAGRWRSRADKVVGGVLAGLAEKFDTSARMLRVAFFIATFVTGFFPGILTYLVLWSVTKEDEEYGGGWR